MDTDVTTKVSLLELKINHILEKLSRHDEEIYDKAWQISLQSSVAIISRQLESLQEVQTSNSDPSLRNAVSRLIQKDPIVVKLENDLKVIQNNLYRHDDRLSQNSASLREITEIQNDIAKTLLHRSSNYLQTKSPNELREFPQPAISWENSTQLTPISVSTIALNVNNINHKDPSLVTSRDFPTSFRNFMKCTFDSIDSLSSRISEMNEQLQQIIKTYESSDSRSLEIRAGNEYQSIKLMQKTQAATDRMMVLNDTKKIENLQAQVIALAKDSQAAWKQARTAVLAYSIRNVRNMFNGSDGRRLRKRFLHWKYAAREMTVILNRRSQGSRVLFSLKMKWIYKSALQAWRENTSAIRTKKQKHMDRQRVVAMKWLVKRRQRWDVFHRLIDWKTFTTIASMRAGVFPKAGEIDPSRLPPGTTATTAITTTMGGPSQQPNQHTSAGKTVTAMDVYQQQRQLQLQPGGRLRRTSMIGSAVDEVVVAYPNEIPVLSVADLDVIIRIGGRIEDCIGLVATYSQGLGHLLSRTVENDKNVWKSLTQVISIVERSSAFNETKLISKINGVEKEMRESIAQAGLKISKNRQEIALMTEDMRAKTMHIDTLMNRVLESVTRVEGLRGIDVEKLERLMLLQGQFLEKADDMEARLQIVERKGQGFGAEVQQSLKLARDSLESVTDLRRQVEKRNAYFDGQRDSIKDRELLAENLINKISEKQEQLQEFVGTQQDRMALRLKEVEHVVAELSVAPPSPEVLCELFLKMEEEVVQSPEDKEVALSRIWTSDYGKNVAQLSQRIANHISTQANAETLFNILGSDKHQLDARVVAMAGEGVVSHTAGWGVVGSGANGIITKDQTFRTGVNNSEMKIEGNTTVLGQRTNQLGALSVGASFSKISMANSSVGGNDLGIGLRGGEGDENLMGVDMILLLENEYLQIKQHLFQQFIMQTEELVDKRKPEPGLVRGHARQVLFSRISDLIEIAIYQSSSSAQILKSVTELLAKEEAERSPGSDLYQRDKSFMLKRSLAGNSSRTLDDSSVFSSRNSRNNKNNSTVERIRSHLIHLAQSQHQHHTGSPTSPRIVTNSPSRRNSISITPPSSNTPVKNSPINLPHEKANRKVRSASSSRGSKAGKEDFRRYTSASYNPFSNSIESENSKLTAYSSSALRRLGSMERMPSYRPLSASSLSVTSRKNSIAEESPDEIKNIEGDDGDESHPLQVLGTSGSFKNTQSVDNSGGSDDQLTSLGHNNANKLSGRKKFSQTELLEVKSMLKKQASLRTILEDKLHDHGIDNPRRKSVDYV